MKTTNKPRLFRDHLKEQLKNPKFKKAFDEYDIAVRLAMAISVAREKAGLTQKELAEKIGSTQPAIARFEAGDETNPELQTIRRLADALAPHFKFTIESKREVEKAA
jgi:ribosome-binding protein aMBF1 (putative translation factor)